MQANAQRCEINRDRFRVAEQKRCTQQQQKSWQEDRSDWINVLQRIEADATLAPSRVVTQKMRNISVCRFMKRYGNDKR